MEILFLYLLEALCFSNNTYDINRYGGTDYEDKDFY